jgi:YegS/Rv2252/BmrU family lipid kinase
MKIRFILNPISGRNRRRPWLAPYIQSLITERRLDAALVVTHAPGHATQLARAALADGCDRVVAVGGDGTMNEIAQGLLNSRVALALVPCGSGNGLALHLKIPTDVRAALAFAVTPGADVVSIDTGEANGRPFFNAMGTGFDAEISHRFNRLDRRGLIAYARTGFAAYLQRETNRVTIDAATRLRELDTLVVTIANSDQYGNNARIAPGARVDDGELDLVAVSPVSPLTALPLIARLFAGTLFGSPHVVHLRGSRFKIARQQSGLIHTDGETHHTGAIIDVVVRPRSLRLLVPARSHGMFHRVVHPANPFQRPAAAVAAFS